MEGKEGSKSHRSSAAHHLMEQRYAARSGPDLSYSQVVSARAIKKNLVGATSGTG